VTEVYNGGPAHPGSAAAQGGKVKGWKERLELMRKQKEDERKRTSESRLSSFHDSQNNTITSSKVADDQSQASKTLTDLFAPTKGLVSGSNGKLTIDKS